MNSKILNLLSGSTDGYLNNELDLNSKNPSNYTATISGVKIVYNLFPGKVLFLGYYQNKGTVTIAVSNHEIVRYLNLKDIQVWNVSKIDKGQLLGHVYSHSGLQFEYCTQWKGSSVYPVRINNNLYYKQNPIDILNGQYTPTLEVDVQSGITRPHDKIVFTPDQTKEWVPVISR